MGLFNFLKKKSITTEYQVEHRELYKSVIPARVGNAMATLTVINEDTIAALHKRYIAFDVETTGLNPSTDRIVEIGAVLFVDGKSVDSFEMLVNSQVRISDSASAINHITNSMLVNAPAEKEVYEKLVAFLGDALNGTTMLCAHNARFDFSFLCNTLSRLGYDADIRYVDTLELSRKHLHGLENYKQNTVASCFNLINCESHRAAADARICGSILTCLLDAVTNGREEQQKHMGKSIPTEGELEVCAYIQDIITKSGGDISWLRYRKNSSNYVDITCLYTFLKFKFAKKGNYIIVHSEAIKGLSVETEPCTASEGGIAFIRVYFSHPFELEPLSAHIYSIFRDCHKSMQDYINMGSYARREAESCIERLVPLSTSKIQALLESAEKRKNAQETSSEYNVKKQIRKETVISRQDVLINPVHMRVPLAQIDNLIDWSKGFDAGFKYWEEGDVFRKEGNLLEAIQLFDRARYNGYNAPALYDSYAKAYRQLKDYANEINILDEGIGRSIAQDTGMLEARRDKAIRLLFAQQESERQV